MGLENSKVTPRAAVESCVSLLLEGRGALSTSFATYTFVIAYGQIVTVSSVAMYYLYVKRKWSVISLSGQEIALCSSQRHLERWLQHKHAMRCAFLGPDSSPPAQSCRARCGL
jgi:cation-transporting ATPase 13A3/4/5